MLPETETVVVDPPIADPPVAKPEMSHHLKKVFEGIGKSFDDVLPPEAEAGEKKEDAAKPPVPPPVVPAAEATPEKPATVIKVIKREALPPAPVVIVPPPPPPTPPTAAELSEAESRKVDEEYIKSLGETERQTIEVARFAESKGKQGVLGAAVKYFRDVDKFMEENPELNEESPEFKKFRRESDPFKGDDSRRWERQMDRETAKNEAKEDFKKEFEPVQLKVREMELKPEIERALAQIETALVTEDKDNQLPGFDPEIIQKMNEVGYEKSVEEYPIEAPLIHRAREAAANWLRITNGTKAFDPNDPVDSWVIRLVNQEGKAMLRQPDSVKIINGRRFVPYGEYIGISRDHPEQLGGVWTLTPEMVTQQIAVNTLWDMKQLEAKLEKSRWKREPKKVAQAVSSAPTPPPPTPPVSDKTTATPKAGAKSQVGATEPGQTNQPDYSQYPHFKVVQEYLDKNS